LDYKPLDLKQVNCVLSEDALLVAGSSAQFETSAQFSFDGNLLRCTCTWKARKPLRDAGVAFVIEAKHDINTERVTLPMSVYNGNPSLDPAAIAPRFPRAAGASFVEEESRFPIPCANVEWAADGHSRFVSLFTIPDDAALEWTLGVHRPATDNICILAASGSVSFNGTRTRTTARRTGM